MQVLLDARVWTNLDALSRLGKGERRRWRIISRRRPGRERRTSARLINLPPPPLTRVSPQGLCPPLSTSAHLLGSSGVVLGIVLEKEAKRSNRELLLAWRARQVGLPLAYRLRLLAAGPRLATAA